MTISIGRIFALFSVIGVCQLSLAATPQEKLIALEKSFDGRMGVYAVNTANNQHIGYRADERFPMQSTFKFMGVTAVLSKSVTNSKLLNKTINYDKQDLVSWSPITELHLPLGMPIVKLCAATMKFSDNTAINLLMKQLGGPQAVTAFARSIGDKTFRADNWEVELNSNRNKVQDTTTPAAMVASLQKITLGNVLPPPLRSQLITWMIDNEVGDSRIRSGVPKGWVVGDKTGASRDYGISNDIGLIWPAQCKPIVVTIYTNRNKKDAKRRDDIIASATRVLIEALAKDDACIWQALA